MKWIQATGLFCALALVLVKAGNAQSTADIGATHGDGVAHSPAAAHERCAPLVSGSAQGIAGQATGRNLPLIDMR